MNAKTQFDSAQYEKMTCEPCLTETEREPCETERSERRARRQRGFSLLETSVALLILLVIGLGAASLFVFSINNNTSASERAMAVAVAQRRIEWLRDLPWDDPNSTNDFVAIPTGQWISQPMRLDNRNFQVRTIITVNPNNRMRTITIEVTPGRGQIWARGAVRFTTQRGPRITV